MSNDAREVKFKKLQKLREVGISPYPDRFERTGMLAEVREFEMGKEVRVAGRIKLLRDMGKIVFVQLQDWSGKLQIVIQKDEVGEESFKNFVSLVDMGDFVGVEGEMFLTKKGEVSVLVKNWTFLGKALQTLPEKWHGVQDKELCYRRRYLDLLMNDETRERFKFRAGFIKALREFYWKNSFEEVETSTLQHRATGANAEPYHTHNNALDLDLVLRISHELPLKMLIVGGYDKVFEIGKAFRNEGIDPSHLPEHTHLEHYCAYWNFEDNIKFTEEMFGYLFENVAQLPKDRKIMILNKNGEAQEVDFKVPFERVSYVELLKKDVGINPLEIEDAGELVRVLKEKGIEIPESELGRGLTTMMDFVYKKVSRPKLIQPTIVYDYPKYMQPLARVSDKDPRIVDQFQLVVNGWEVVKAYSELVDPVDQAERFKEQLVAKEGGDNEAMEGDDEYILAMEYGMPPISGWGMGIDRIVTLFSQQENLRDLVLFPLMRPEVSAGNEEKNEEA